jgi:hypothetical protein
MPAPVIATPRRFTPLRGGNHSSVMKRSLLTLESLRDLVLNADRLALLDHESAGSREDHRLQRLEGRGAGLVPAVVSDRFRLAQTGAGGRDVPQTRLSCLSGEVLRLAIVWGVGKRGVLREPTDVAPVGRGHVGVAGEDFGLALVDLQDALVHKGEELRG